MRDFIIEMHHDSSPPIFRGAEILRIKKNPFWQNFNKGKAQ
jgi:hypothetical protein